MTHKNHATGHYVNAYCRQQVTIPGCDKDETRPRLRSLEHRRQSCVDYTEPSHTSQPTRKISVSTADKAHNWLTTTNNTAISVETTDPQLYCNCTTAVKVKTYKTTANRCQHAPADVFDPSVPVFWLFHAPEQTTAIVILPSMDVVCGTVFLMNWDHLTSLWLRSETNWRCLYLTCTGNCCF